MASTIIITGTNMGNPDRPTEGEYVEHISVQSNADALELAKLFNNRRTVRPVHVHGYDSDVYEVFTKKGDRSYLVQIYRRFYDRYPGEDRVGMVKEYASDMRRWSGYLSQNPNPLRQAISVNGRKWSLRYRVATKDRYLEVNGVPALASKEVVPGDNLDILLKQYSAQMAGQSWSLGIEAAEEQDSYLSIQGKVHELFEHMNDQLGCQYRFGDMNVKLEWNDTKSEVVVTITDAAYDLHADIERKRLFNDLIRRTTPPT